MDLERLLREGTKLQSEQAAFQVQSKLLENFLEMARCSSEEEMLKSELQKTLEITTSLTGAEKSSIFLLDSNGVVTDSILARGDVSSEQRSQLTGTVLNKGLAGWVCRHCKIGLITDTETDDRWLTLPDQPYKVRSSLAVPIIRGKDLVGILTLLHSQPNHFNRDTANLMIGVADQIALCIENAKLYVKLDESYHSLEKAKQEIEAYSNALDKELEKSRQIQREFLPTEIPRIPGWEISACFHPARQVAGDFYDAFVLPGDYLGLSIGDVCDKGLGAALFMALFRSLIRVFAKQCSLHKTSLPGIRENVLDVTAVEQANALRAVSFTNSYVSQEHTEMCMFATMFFGVLDPKTGLLAYINAGHEPPLAVNAKGIKQYLHPTGPAVGVLPDAPFDIHLYQFEPDDILLCFTDGVTEASSPNGKLFARERLLELIEELKFSPVSIMDRIKLDLFKHIDDAPQSDDITMLAVHKSS
jgi:sigma-B regulation protein RsbU (phosphoserine phosphatase)